MGIPITPSKFSLWLNRQLLRAQESTHRPGFPLFLLMMAASDLFLVVIPTDGLVIAAVFSQPRKWFLYAVAATIGSTLGASILAAIVYLDANWLIQNFPSFFESSAWSRVEELTLQYGSLGVFVGAAGPLPLQPFVIVPALAQMDPQKLLLSYILGRFIKFCAVAWVASHAPNLLRRIPGVGREWKSYSEKTGKTRD